MTWTFDPLTVALMLVSAAAYGRGVRAAWRQVGPGAGFRPWHLAAFCAGLLGDPDRGTAAVGRYGCGSCHDISGIRSARGTVGPPLGRIAVRTYLAGRLWNTPANMMQWIQHPQHIERGTAMPETGVADADARDITAFLYTLR